VNKASEHGIFVRLVLRDGEEMYEARVVELQDVVAFGESHAEAYESALQAIEGLQEMFAEKGKSLPPPEIEETEFSGRVTLRMSKSLHAAVHRRASLDDVSLNQWIVEAVACRVNGSFTADSDMVACHARQDTSGNIEVRLQQPNYFVTYGGANIFAVQGVQEATPASSTPVPCIELRPYGQHQSIPI
jgi:predicted HicB family RNase H-like nuclease